MSYTPVPLVVAGDWIDEVFINTYWANNMAAGVPDIFSAKGDLAVATAANAATALAVGANNKILIADSAQLSGVKWDYNFFPLTSFYTSVNWNGDAKAVGTYTVALSEFWASIPTVRAVLLSLSASWAAASGGSVVNVRPPGASDNGLVVRALVAGVFSDNNGIVPVSSNNIEVVVAGAAATTYINLWGYWL